MDKDTKNIATSPHFVDPCALSAAPHAWFAELRPETPFVRLGPNQYLVLRGEPVQSLLTDPRTRQIEGPEFVALHQIPDGITARFLSDIFLFANGDAHRGKRGLFARSFAHRIMRDVRGQVRGIADGIVASLPRGESFDFVDRMAARVPADMIGAILGLPESDSRYFARLVYDVARAFTLVYPHDHHDAIESATQELFDYVQGQMRMRILAPRDDLLSALVADWRTEKDMSFDSLVFQTVGLIIAGSDTTRSAFAMLVALLLQRDVDWAAIWFDSTLIPGAVDEGMRYEPSVASIPRVTTESIEIDGIGLPAGSVLHLSTMSAMRDPALYVDPDRFDIRRADHPRLHMVFGFGPHRCLGELLARIEMEESLAAVLDAVRGIELETPPRMLGFGGVRQITPMQVRIP